MTARVETRRLSIIARSTAAKRLRAKGRRRVKVTLNRTCPQGLRADRKGGGLVTEECREGRVEGISYKGKILGRKERKEKICYSNRKIFKKQAYRRGKPKSGWNRGRGLPLLGGLKNKTRNEKEGKKRMPPRLGISFKRRKNRRKNQCLTILRVRKLKDNPQN